MNEQEKSRRHVEVLAEAARIPVAPEKAEDLASRWSMFAAGIEGLASLIRDTDGPVTIYVPGGHQHEP